MNSKRKSGAEQRLVSKNKKLKECASHPGQMKLSFVKQSCVAIDVMCAIPQVGLSIVASEPESSYPMNSVLLKNDINFVDKSPCTSSHTANTEADGHKDLVRRKINSTEPSEREIINLDIIPFDIFAKIDKTVQIDNASKVAEVTNETAKIDTATHVNEWHSGMKVDVQWLLKNHKYLQLKHEKD